MGEKPGGVVRNASRAGAKMKAVVEIVALYQGRELFSGKELAVCLRERYGVERLREEVLQILMLPILEGLEEGSAEWPLTQGKLATTDQHN